MIQTSRPSSFNFLSFFFALIAMSLGAVIAFSVATIEGDWIWLGVIGGFIVGVGTLLSLEFGLMALVFMTYIRLFNIIEIRGGPSLAFPFMLFLSSLIVFRWILEQRLNQIWLKTPLMFALYSLSTFISVLFASDFARAQGDLWAFVKGASVAIVVGLLLTRKEAIRGVFWSLLGVGIILGSISVYQFLTSSFTNDFWGFGVATIQNIVGETNDYRVSGSLGDPNLFAMVMVVLVPIALERLANEKRFVLRALAAYALLVSVLAIIFTYSRGGFLALCVVAGLSLFWRKPPVITVLIVAILIVTTIPFLPPSYAARMQTITDFISPSEVSLKSEVSFRGRVSELGVAWMMLRDHPITGVGAGNYNTEYLDYSRQLGWDPRNEERGAHNLYLEVAAEQGLIGLSVLVYILYSLLMGLYSAAHRFRTSNQTLYGDMAIAMLVGMVGYLSASLFIHNVFPYYLWMLIGISMAIVQIAELDYQEYLTGATSIISQENVA